MAVSLIAALNNIIYACACEHNKIFIRNLMIKKNMITKVFIETMQSYLLGKVEKGVKCACFSYLSHECNDDDKKDMNRDT